MAGGLSYGRMVRRFGGGSGRVGGDGFIFKIDSDLRFKMGFVCGDWGWVGLHLGAKA